MRNANGFGSIIKLSGKRRRPYAVRVTAGWTDDGKQVFKYISYHEKKMEAKKALDAYNVNPYDLDAAGITFEEVYNQWSAKAYTELSKSAANTYRSAFRYASGLYSVRFRDLRANTLQATVDAVESPSMAKMTKFLFQKLFTYALENDIVEKDYSKFIKLQKAQDAKKKNPLTQADIQNLWTNIDTVEYVDITLVLLYTGMRIGELLEMKKENVHLDERYMVGGNKTEAGKERVIPIHKRIAPIIEKYMEKSKGEFAFTDKRGNQISYDTFIKNKWPKIKKLISTNDSPHVTRHTFISNLDRLGVNALIIKRIVGHSNSDITEHYTHKSIAELLAAVDLLE